MPNYLVFNYVILIIGAAIFTGFIDKAVIINGIIALTKQGI